MARGKLKVVRSCGHYQFSMAKGEAEPTRAGVDWERVTERDDER